MAGPGSPSKQRNPTKHWATNQGRTGNPGATVPGPRLASRDPEPQTRPWWSDGLVLGPPSPQLSGGERVCNRLTQPRLSEFSRRNTRRPSGVEPATKAHREIRTSNVGAVHEDSRRAPGTKLSRSGGRFDVNLFHRQVSSAAGRRSRAQDAACFVDVGATGEVEKLNLHAGRDNPASG